MTPRSTLGATRPALLTRRQMLETSGLGVGAIALSSMLHDEGLCASGSTGDRGRSTTHFPAAAKSVVVFMQNGGPGQMELFDPKPALQRYSGKVHSVKVEMFQKGSEGNQLLQSPFAFHRRGECGMELSEVIPHIGSMADDLCLVRSMYSEHNNHTEALVMISTGKIFPGRPTLGSWASYALGTENRNLPAFIVLRDPEGYNTSGTLLWQNGWLPAVHRGTEFSTKGAPVPNLRPATDLPAGVQRETRAFVAKLNGLHREGYPHESALEARIRNYELAARMQLAASEVLDLSGETEATRRRYGLDNKTTVAYGTRCLMARRLIENGVRFVQIHPPKGQPWDSHSNVKSQNEKVCGQTDLPAAALIQDLKDRGLLDSTIVLWTGEFGRLPVSQNGKGRDHNRNAFSLVLAGGGFRAGHVHGATDEVGYRAAVDRVSVPDLHATILHQLGLDHTRVTYEHHGREESLTDAPVTGAKVVEGMIDGPVMV